jgi:hypothetical protein
MRALLSPRGLLSPRRGRAEPPPPPSPAFLGLLASPLPAARRARAAARASAPPPPARRPWRSLGLLRRLLLSSTPFLLGVLLSALLFASAPPPGALRDGDDGLRAALAATRDALALWRVVLAPGVAQVARSGFDFALHAAAAAAAVPLETYAVAAAALAACSAALVAWRALSRALAAANAVVSRRYTVLHSALQRRSRAAAALLPHAATVGATAAALSLAPPALSHAALSVPSLCCMTLALPALASLLALRAPLSSRAEAPPALRPARRWLAYWAALSPALLLADAPLLPALAARLPGAHAAWAVALVWLLAPPTRGADMLAAALAPRLAPLGNRAATARHGPRAQAAAAALRTAAAALRVPAGVVHAAEAALRSATPLLLATAVGLVTPGALTRYAAAVAGVLCPAASSLAAMSAQPPAPAFERGWLTYWSVYGAAAAAALAAPGLGALPLAQHGRLLAVLWLQLLGGAPRVAAAAAETLAFALTSLRVAGTRLTPAPELLQAADAEPPRPQGDAAEAEAFALRRASEPDDVDVVGARRAAVSPEPGASGGARRRSRKQASADEATPQRA